MKRKVLENCMYLDRNEIKYTGLVTSIIVYTQNKTLL